MRDVSATQKHHSTLLAGEFSISSRQFGEQRENHRDGQECTRNQVNWTENRSIKGMDIVRGYVGQWSTVEKTFDFASHSCEFFYGKLPSTNAAGE
uniref:Uncharacterized protein n=1 Tax=Pristionchus pacificus TaxID=54126 RepID=A0A2A6D2R9_PRIPA|eukprot:PDM84689.1 hypothetical protein PRIPAC_33712 [Pristionchus pacificus]